MKHVGIAFLIGGSAGAFLWLCVEKGLEWGYRAADYRARRREAHERTV